MQSVLLTAHVAPVKMHVTHVASYRLNLPLVFEVSGFVGLVNEVTWMPWSTRSDVEDLLSDTFATQATYQLLISKPCVLPQHSRSTN